ncbi:MAG: 6-pyruvoyl tetrahydrobiopterin synthase [Candidatus Lokiarchaeota archaeon]|nr:6-pyruvoyl tetrahydrobiopterin synthase [Candidatus Lokiarchaeota archaeon]
MHFVQVKDQKMHFSSAHFVIGSDYCENLHGHNYMVEIFVQAPLDEHSMVIDFTKLKKDGRKICQSLDHKVLLPKHSTKIRITTIEDSIEVRVEGKRYLIPSEDCIMLPIEATTAELLAEYISTKLEIPNALRLRVCVEETPGSIACFERTHDKIGEK